MSTSDQQNTKKDGKSAADNAPDQTKNQSAAPAHSVEELTDMLQRNQANFENYRKQVQQRITDAEQMALRKFLTELLPVLDTFHLALKNPTQNVEDVREGMELLYAQLLSALEKNGVTPLETVGKKFDPLLHQPLMKVASEKPIDTVIEEFQRGYTLHGKVLRAARVKVSGGANAKTVEDSHSKKDENKNSKH